MTEVQMSVANAFLYLLTLNSIYKQNLWSIPFFLTHFYLKSSYFSIFFWKKYIAEPL